MLLTKRQQPLMTRHERLMATLKGLPVDRPAVCFYEITGEENRGNEDAFNIFSHPSWQPLLDLAAEKSDRILMLSPSFLNAPPDPLQELTAQHSWEQGNSRFRSIEIQAQGRKLKSLRKQDRDIHTWWQLEHLLKDTEDLKAWLELPETPFGGKPDVSLILNAEKSLGDTGIAMIDTPDPLCVVAALFDMGTYTMIALTEQELFHKALEKVVRLLHQRTEAIARALPGRLWRIYGPEYASAPYLPPNLFDEYVVRYDKPMVESIHRYGGFARIHSHGNLKAILDSIIDTGCMGLDPIEPPPQGDVSLAYVRERYGKNLVLFGNLEASDIENLTPVLFETKVRNALREGTAGTGRGFVLMPSACPYGRALSNQALKNYKTMIKCAEGG